jgi:dihydroorotase
MYVKSKRVFINNKLLPACIYVLSNKIESIHSYSYKPNDYVFDFADNIILPAGIDGHVHFREPEAPEKEDFYSGSASAIAGGVSVFLDMPCYHSPPTTTVGALAEKERLAYKNSLCDFGFHFGATDTNVDLIKKLQPPSLKAFLAETNSPLTLSDVGLEKHFTSFNPNNIFLIHCEDESVIQKNKSLYKEHYKIRSLEAALSGIKKVKKLYSKFKRRIHFCHLTTSKEIELAKKDNKKIKDNPNLFPNYISCEVATHHLFLSIKDAKELGNLANVNPPLRSEKEVALLWKKLNKIDCIVSDHAPHTFEQKQAGASGFIGVQTLIPLLLDAVLQRRLSLENAVRLFSSGPAQVFNIYKKGKIAPGYDADFFVFDPSASWKIKEGDLFSKSGWSPYLGRVLKGKIIATFLRGQNVYYEGKILAKPGYGKPVIRSLSSSNSPSIFFKKHSKESHNLFY